jgi:hypothetical protein
MQGASYSLDRIKRPDQKCFIQKFLDLKCLVSLVSIPGSAFLDQHSWISIPGSA